MLHPSLGWREDRPSTIPLVQVGRVAIRRYNSPKHGGNVPATINGSDQPTQFLNGDSLSEHKTLLSRAHAELGWVQATDGTRTLMIYDGSPREHKASSNGSAVNGVLVPLGASAPVPAGAEVWFGAPHLLPASLGRKRQKTPFEFVYTFGTPAAMAPAAPVAPAAPAAVAAAATPAATPGATPAVAPAPASSPLSRGRAIMRTSSSASALPSTPSAAPGTQTFSQPSHPQQACPPSPSKSPGKRRRKSSLGNLPSAPRAAPPPTPVLYSSAAERAQAAADAIAAIKTVEVGVGCEALLFGQAGCEGGASLNRNLRNLIDNSSTRAAPGVVREGSQDSRSQESLSQDVGGSSAMTKAAREVVAAARCKSSLMALTLSRLGLALPSKLSVHDMAVMLAPTSTHDDLLSATASLRSRAVVISASATSATSSASSSASTDASSSDSSMSPPPQLLSAPALSLLTNVLDASAALVRLGGAGSTGRALHTEYGDSEDEEEESTDIFAIRHASTRLSLLCSLFARAPWFAAPHFASIPAKACRALAMSSLGLFDALATARAATEEAKATGDAQLAQEATRLAARVLVLTAEYAAPLIVERCAVVAGGCNASSSSKSCAVAVAASNSGLGLASTLCPLEYVLCSLGQVEEAPDAADALLVSVLEALLSSSRFRDGSTCSAPPPCVASEKLLAAACAVLWRRPSQSNAWDAVLVCALHALQLLMRRSAPAAAERHARAALDDLCSAYENAQPDRAVWTAMPWLLLRWRPCTG